MITHLSGEYELTSVYKVSRARTGSCEYYKVRPLTKQEVRAEAFRLQALQHAACDALASCGRIVDDAILIDDPVSEPTADLVAQYHAATEALERFVSDPGMVTEAISEATYYSEGGQ